MGTVGWGMDPMPTLIRSVRSLEKDGFLGADGMFKPPLPEGALPGLPEVGGFVG
jgi:hypothetical protein